MSTNTNAQIYVKKYRLELKFSNTFLKLARWQHDILLYFMSISKINYLYLDFEARNFFPK